MIKTDFIPIDYDYFDFEGRNYAKITGRNNQGKRVCIIDSCPVYLWAVLKENIKQNKINALIEKIKKIKLNIKGRQTRVEGVDLHDKNFLDKKVKALKIFATNYKDLHDIADKLDMDGIESILETMFRHGWAAQNIVFGMGGHLLQQMNRDTQRNAFKSSWQQRDGIGYDIKKNPLDKSKVSKSGRLALIKDIKDLRLK